MTHLRAVPTESGGHELTDTLVERARDGDTRAWARLYQTHFDRLFRRVHYQVGNAAVAEDLVQESFAAALSSLHRFDGRASFWTWLCAVAQNVIRKHWRSSSRRDRAYDRLQRVERGAARVPEEPDAQHLTQTRAEVLAAVLETLPDHLREAFVLVDVQGVAPAEAAGQLGISPGNVRVRATRARKKIRAELERLGWIGTGGSA